MGPLGVLHSSNRLIHRQEKVPGASPFDPALIAKAQRDSGLVIPHQAAAGPWLTAPLAARALLDLTDTAVVPPGGSVQRVAVGLAAFLERVAEVTSCGVRGTRT